MKKIIAILLSVVCIFTSMGISVSALDDVVDSIGGNIGLEPDEPIIYGIVYEMETLDGVSVLYKPSPTFSFSSPGTYTITNDTPLAVDYDFVCWEHEETGKHYYAGDKLYIDGQEVLIAVWKPKTDGHIRTTRVLLTAIEALRRTIGAFFGFYKVIDDFKADLAAPKPTYQYSSIDSLGAEIININNDDTYAENPRKYTLVIKSDKTFDAVYETVDVNFYGDQYQAITGTDYPAYFSITTDTMEYDGAQCQFITISFVDGVPTPATGTKLTITLPKGLLKYDTGAVNSQNMPVYAANEAYTLDFLVTSYV
ncbi:MAG: hypothetical protein IJW86_00985 [Clostridia bacterium]|nr:hypothetical protein [Clostridia bacterium]